MVQSSTVIFFALMGLETPQFVTLLIGLYTIEVVLECTCIVHWHPWHQPEHQETEGY